MARDLWLLVNKPRPCAMPSADSVCLGSGQMPKVKGQVLPPTDNYTCATGLSAHLGEKARVVLVSSPDPRGNGLVNQVEFLGLAHAFATM